LTAAAALVKEGRVLAEQAPTPMTQALISYADGILALYRGELALASSCLQHTVEVLSSNKQGHLYVIATVLLGWVHQLAGDQKQAIDCHQQVLSITEACGESFLRSVALQGIGLAAWQHGERSRAMTLFEDSLRVNRRVRSPVLAAASLDALAWTVGAGGDAERAATLMGAAQELDQSVGNIASLAPLMPQHHDESVRLIRTALGARRFDAGFRRGRALGMDEAVAYALGEHTTHTTPASGPGVVLTKRERQIADLVAQGLSNKQIAAKLVISQRTAEGHVEHILTKLGFTSRAQIAAWVAEDSERQNR
ncbi:LuxR family transcriptional regulator, partial [Nocardia vaccinii]|uniref:LuxR family transcriptional regulator n=1 Tax=Nocardia vaccinii TaxID=1822 RepID=UPI000A518E9E